MKNDDLSYVSLLGKGSTIRNGSISVASHLKISGIIIQNIECAGKLVISGTGVVQGNIKAQDLVIEGIFEGNMWVENHITILKSARVTGYLSAGKLKIEEGAFCQIDTNVDHHAKSRFDRAGLDATAGLPRSDLEKLAAAARSNGSGKPRKEKKKQPEADIRRESPGKIEIDRFW